MFTKSVTVAALVAVASAQIPAVARRDFVEPRQTTLSDACNTAIAEILPLYNELPTVPADLATATLPSDPCETPSFTGTLSAEYASYTSEVFAWYTSNSAELLSALAQCTELAASASDIPICTGAVIATGGSSETGTVTGTDSSAATGTAASGSSSSGAEATTTGTGSAATGTGAGSTGASKSTSASGSAASASGSATASKNVAPRETSYIAAAAVAAAGILAGVAAL
ncbi:hypothetical protein BX600DRAFT_444635 [Xylariales sp. PMI_506]|nr:hypothetical protein BX600DRAFT_444635 [Xylariales sp. PMI_506]